MGERLHNIIYPTFTKEFLYDDEGRVSEEIYHLSETESYSVIFTYDAFGRLESTTGPDNETTSYTYDLLGRRISVTDPSGQTSFEYDLWDNLVALTDAENQRTEFEYYPDGKLWKERRPMSEETQYEYDNFGRLWKILDAKGQTTEYGYDSQWRIETISYADGKTVTLTYDADGNLAGYSDGETSASYTFDAMGRKLTETVDYGPFSKTFSYTYYGNGLKHTFTAPDSTVYTYTYGLNNELQSIQIPGVGNIEIPAYTWNRPATITYPGGTQRSYTYDALMRLESLSALDPSSTPLLDYTYTYDEVGNILTKVTEHGNYSYGYDAVSRLITADNPVLDDEAYTYDHVGNRLTSADVSGSWTYNFNNELLGYADVEYEYDANGNMTQKRVGTAAVNYIYDAANRLVKVEDDATQTVIAEYSYDPFGRRLWKEVGGVRTYFFYSEEGLIAEYDENGVEIRSYGYKPDSTWTTDPLWLKDGGSYSWYQNDHLGTPQKLVATDGTVVWSAQYTAFGEADVQVETIENNLRFPGQYEDVETGLHYNFQRFYDPKIGRYLKKDPIGFSGRDVNLYNYVKNNPLHRIDPFGMASLTEIEDLTLYYTWHMGWIDTHHAFENLGAPSLKEAWEKIQKAHDNEEIPFTLKQAGVVASSVGDFCVNVAPKNPNHTDPLINRKNQLLYAWMVITEEFEKAQGEFWLGWKLANKVGGIVKKLQIDQQPSTFSTEDLVSNLISFYTVVDGVDRGLVDALAGKFDAQDEPELSRMIWMLGFKTQPGHTTWMDPVFFDYEQHLEDLRQPGLQPWLFMASMGMPVGKFVGLLEKYKERFGPPDFPDEFEIYYGRSEGYIRITGKSMWKNYPGLPEVRYWRRI